MADEPRGVAVAERVRALRLRQEVGAAIADRRVAQRAGYPFVPVVIVREHGKRRCSGGGQVDSF
ncbi:MULTISPECIES: hypothetical protein [Burkholderia]|uniref:hypothetical protein n=1 Tax=Burkholderia TaxID=32008 RepID=UPI0015895718|nr:MULTISPECIES: hypothetical protein [Burkholderia]MBR8208759.1 hypothetical protein [Burkholderia cenocepacia]MCA8235770.1 hypothetical protein [Burkholderia cenocepacia]